MSDDPYHWPPELMSMLIDTIPLLCRSKDDVLSFVRGAGVPETTLSPWRRRLAADRDTVKKYPMVREILTAVNEQGDHGLGARRAILQRVVEFEEFSTCWPDDQLKAKGLIADVRKVVNAKDSFTRMRQTAEAEQTARRADRQAEIDRLAARRTRCRDLHRELVALFSESNEQRRGTALEPILNQVFAMDGLLIRESFTLRSEDGKPFEQIDGVVELDAQQYLVEMKWWGSPIGRDAASSHLVRVYNRGGVRGLFISASGYTEPAIADHETALVNKIVMLLEHERDIAEWLRQKVRYATVERKPYIRPGIDAA